MASQLKVDTLTGVTTAGSIVVTGEGNSTTTNLQQGLSKCWCLFNGQGTIAIRDSFNSSGLTDIGTGIYQVNYSNNTASANTVTSGSNVGDSATSNRTNGQIGAYGSVTTALTYFTTNYDANAYADFTHVGITVAGDLA